MARIAVLLLLAAIQIALANAATPPPPKYGHHDDSGFKTLPKCDQLGVDKTDGRSQKWPEYKGINQKVEKGCRPKTNMIFMVSDGFGLASETFAREYLMAKTYGSTLSALQEVDYVLPLDGRLVGAVRTKSTDQWVTDSAAAATAYATGKKTFNAGIGVDPKGRPWPTTMEAAHQNGYKTALVATSRITHATPASWSAHVMDRDWEDIIAAQQIGDNVLGQSVDLMIGGGRQFFLPKSAKGSIRKDERDLTKEAKEKYGFKTYVENRDQLLSVKEAASSLPMLGLFTNSHMSYEIDRNSTVEPSLAEMAQKALSILSAATSDCDSPGFFIMIEGSRIDMAAHSNDAAGHVHDILAYQDAVAIVKSYVAANPQTIALSVSDHETGGLTVGAQPDLTQPAINFYKWNPEVLFNVKSSFDVTLSILDKYTGNDLPGFIRSTVADRLGIKDLTDVEISNLVRGIQDNNAKKYPGTYQDEIGLSPIVNNRALVGFTSKGHTGVDVGLFAINAPNLYGNLDNTYLAGYTAKTLGIAETMKRLESRVARQKVDNKLRKRGEIVFDADRHHEHGHAH
ncbi:hypothetical protein RI367_002776 [Sorochytrium milnesiophthora]